MPDAPDRFDIFLSYAHADDADGSIAAVCAELESRLGATGPRPLRVFRDHDGIRRFDDWKVRCHRVLRDTRFFVVFFSKAYLRSQACWWEWVEWGKLETARGRGKLAVVSLWLEEDIAAPDGNAALPEEASQWRAEIRACRCVDFRGWRNVGAGTRAGAGLSPAPIDSLAEHIIAEVRHMEACRKRPGNIGESRPLFTGRARELHRLQDWLEAESTAARPAVLVGVGGVGKSALAREFATRHAERFRGGVWLVHCEGHGTLDRAISTLSDELVALELTDAEKMDNRLAAKRVLEHIAASGECLLILDNVDHASVLTPTEMDLLEGRRNVRVVVTTRLPAVDLAQAGAQFEKIEIGYLDKGEAVDLIRMYQYGGTFASASDHQNALAICDLLGGYTLAVETAAVFLGQNDPRAAAAQFAVRIEDYLEALRADLSRRPAGDAKLSQLREVASTMQPTLDRLSAAALFVLRAAALMGSDAIPLPWLRAIAGAVHPSLAAKSEYGESDPWTDLVRQLGGMRLLVPNSAHPQLASFHRILQQVLISESATEEMERMREDVQGHLKDRVSALEKTTQWTTARWELEPLDALARRWDDDRHPGAEWLLSQAGVSWQQIGELGRADAPLRRCVEISARTLGPDHTNYASALGNLAQLLFECGSIDEAERMMREALRIQETGTPRDDGKVSVRLNNLAILLRATAETGSERMKEAESMMRRALRLDEARQPADPPTVGIRLGNLALLLHATERPQEAEGLLRRALDIDLKYLPQPHTNVAIDLSNLGQVLLTRYESEGDDALLDEAEEVGRRAIEIDESCFGPDHPTVASDKSNLAVILQASGRNRESETLLRDALRIDTASFDAGHPRLALRHDKLAICLLETGRHAEALPHMREALSINERRLGPSHPDVAVALANLGNVLAKLGLLPEAAEVLNRAWKIDEKRLGEDHAFIALRLNDLALVIHRRGSHAEAAAMMRRALAIDRRYRKPDDPVIALDLANLAQILADSGELKEAETLTREALHIQKRCLSPDDPAIVASLKSLAMLLHRASRHAEGVPFMREALQHEINLYGADHPVPADCERLLAEMEKAAQRTHWLRW